MHKRRTTPYKLRQLLALIQSPRLCARPLHRDAHSTQHERLHLILGNKRTNLAQFQTREAVSHRREEESAGLKEGSEALGIDDEAHGLGAKTLERWLHVVRGLGVDLLAYC
jgi:hypothetical protein